ncbi:MAG: hypothetical protein GY811_18830 [Myxococcales bacterium]|nr:hypothetical protein [Myxococcales bacterium]
MEIRDSAGAQVPGMTLDATPFMPDHGHGSPIPAFSTDEGSGTYTLEPVNLFMPGYWETTLTIVNPNGTDSPDDDFDLDTVVFVFFIDG